jgi:NTE family protein
MKVLCLSSGGMHGINTLGYLHKKMKDDKDFNNFTHIIGSSVGSIIGMLMCIGYTPYEIYKKLKHVNFKKFIDKEDIDIINIFNNFRSSKVDNYCLDNAVKFRNIIIEFMNDKGVDKNITFNELFKKTDIKLYINAININKRKDKLFSAFISPDVSVLESVMASSSIPILFPPVKIYNNYYIDGGAISEAPIKHLIYLMNETNEINENIIYIQYYKIDYYNNNINNISSYLQTLYKILRHHSNYINESDIIKKINMYNKTNVDNKIDKNIINFINVHIKNNDNSINFNLTKSDVVRIFKSTLKVL